jgi:hypothetical protein
MIANIAAMNAAHQGVAGAARQDIAGSFERLISASVFSPIVAGCR